METLIYYLSAIPDVIWAAIIASFLTFTGVLLTNRHFYRQQQAQLDHEKEQKEKDRKFALRQSVYLSAAEELTLAQQHLVNLSNIDLVKTGPSDYLTSFFVAATKASLVASDKTAKAINELLAAYGVVFFELLAKTLPIQGVRTEHDIQNTAYGQYQAEVSRILVSMTQFNEEAKVDSIVWDALNRNLEFNQEQARIAADKRSNAGDKLNALKIEFAKEAFSKSKRVAELAVPALVAIRSELDIPSDLAAYHSEVEKRFAQMEETFDKFLEEVGGETA
jgi:hypothetical protein